MMGYLKRCIHAVAYSLVLRRKPIFVSCLVGIAISVFACVVMLIEYLPEQKGASIHTAASYFMVILFCAGGAILIKKTENMEGERKRENIYYAYFTVFSLYLTTAAIGLSYADCIYGDSFPLAYFIIMSIIPLLLVHEPIQVFCYELFGAIIVSSVLITQADYSCISCINFFVFALIISIGSIALYRLSAKTTTEYDAALSSSLTDELTKTANRRDFERQLAYLHHYKGNYVIVISDIDDFKRKNDGEGHLAGDRVLRQYANCLKESFKYVYRYGGDEFAILSKLSPDEVIYRIKQAQQSLAELNISACFGISKVPPLKDAREYFALADAALLKAKEKGRGQIAIHDGENINQPI